MSVQVERNKKRKKLISLVNEIAETVRKHKRVKITVLAIKYGYSRHYFRYHILPLVLDSFEDIKLVRIDGIEYLVYEGTEE